MTHNTIKKNVPYKIATISWLSYRQITATVCAAVNVTLFKMSPMLESTQNCPQ